MANYRKSDSNCVSFSAQESEDLFADNSQSLLAQETQDFFADSLQLPSTDPKEGPSSQKISINCEGYLKDYTS